MNFEINEMVWCSHHGCFVKVFSPELSPVNTIGCQFRDGQTQYIPDIYLHKISETSLKLYEEAISCGFQEEVEKWTIKNRNRDNTWDDAIADAYNEWIK